MSIHIHSLTGCAPVPLAHYLKAIGILRLVAEQADPDARGWWIGDSFRLGTILGRDELERFFLHDYCPTPLVAPWNGGSGFHPKDNKTGIDALRGSAGARFAAYRAQIEQTARELARNSGQSKESQLRDCASHWRGSTGDWLAAAVVIRPDGSPGYPALLGTGGNDGRLDFTNNFMQNLALLFAMDDDVGAPLPGALESLQAALFQESTPKSTSPRAIGQFLPGCAGGANAANGFDASSAVNLFDYILMLEGAVVFSAGLSRRCDAGARAQAAAPFTVRASSIGYGSGALAEQSARGEQWMPIWAQPITYPELKATIAEGRCQIGRTSAHRPLDFARAVARLGVSRGIREFQRFGYIERNGQANLATPLGRWRVQAQPHQDLLDEVCPWIDWLCQAGTDKHAPAAIGRVARNCQEAAMGCCRSGREPERWQRLLVALGEAEAQLLRSPRFTAERRLSPIPRLSPAWVEAANSSECTELRLALALAGQFAPAKQRELDWWNPIRRHFLPLDKFATRFQVANDSLAKDPNVVRSDDFEQTALDIVRRRLLLGCDVENVPFPLRAVRGVHAQAKDIAAFLAGDTDDARLLSLCHPLMALDFRRKPVPSLSSAAGEYAEARSFPLFALFKLCHLSFPVPVPSLENGHSDSVPVRPDRAILARLGAGDLSAAVHIAVRRLTASGIRPHFANACGETALARRLGAALVFPVSPSLAATFARIVTQPFKEKGSQSADS